MYIAALDGEGGEILKHLTFVSGKGINKRLLARWLNLQNLNNVNLLLEYGIIQENEFHKIALHPLIKEITIDDKEPSIANCKAFIENMHGEYLLHGIDLPYYKTMFEVTENIICIAYKDDIEIYKAFIKDAFAYMERYAYKSGMSLIISELEQYSESVDDTALILDYKSAYEHIINGDMQKSAEYEMQAVNLCDSLTNPHLKANIYANMGGLYHAESEMLKAKEFMEKAYRILTENNLQYTADSLTQICNYASLAANMGEPQRAIQALEKCTEHIIPNTIIHAELLENIGLIYLQMNDIPNAKEKLTQSLNIYSEVWEDSPELTEQKISEIKEQIFLLNNSITEN